MEIAYLLTGAGILLIGIIFGWAMGSAKSKNEVK